MAVAQAALVPPPSEDVKNRLFTLVQSTLYKDRERGESLDLRGIFNHFGVALGGLEVLLYAYRINLHVDEDMKSQEERGLDLESTEPPPARVIPNYNTKFITTHKNPCRVAKFSPDGMNFSK